MSRQYVDINCDMGESFGQWRIGDSTDESLFPFISSANIATGFHAGDPGLMDSMVRLAVKNSVGIGAHPGFRDLQGFGRRRIHATSAELLNDITYQVGALREFTFRHGGRLRHVKPHGALYMLMAEDEDLSARFVDYMRSVNPDTYIFCMPTSKTYELAEKAGQPVVREFFADRDYDDSGSIVFTRKVGRPDPRVIAEKVLMACMDGKVIAESGNIVDIEFDSVCFHSDTPGCYDIAAKMKEVLEGNGIRIKSPPALPAQGSFS